MMPLTKEQLAQKKIGLSERANRFYDATLKHLLEPANIGKFLAIEPETGKYFLGSTAIAALDAAHEAMPDNLFYLKRIGYQAAHTIGGRVVRNKG